MERTPCIFQTGRLGDLWMTLPLGYYLFKRFNKPIPVYYDRIYGNDVFKFFPFVTGQPLDIKKILPEHNRVLRVISQGMGQLNTFFSLKKRHHEIIWNQIFPWRWFFARINNQPYPHYWYRNYPDALKSRVVPTNLNVKNGETILVFLESQSLPQLNSKYARIWLERNLDTLVKKTGFKPLVVAYGDQPYHKHYETWRGSMDEYQNLIADCGVVYGISTSAHVLGQVLGKPVIPLYGKNQHVMDTIGQEPLRLIEGTDFSKQDMGKLDDHLSKESPRTSEII